VCASGATRSPPSSRGWRRGCPTRRSCGRKAAQGALAKEQPHWQAWEARRDRTLSLDGERRIAEQAVTAARQEFQRLDRELAEALAARESLKRLEPELVPIQALQQERDGLEALQREEAVRREELAKLVWELRRKLEPFDAEHLIENERRLGYRLRTCRDR